MMIVEVKCLLLSLRIQFIERVSEYSALDVWIKILGTRNKDTILTESSVHLRSEFGSVGLSSGVRKVK